MKLLFLLALVFISTSSLKCNKDKDNSNARLPPATKSGNNTFGFIVDNMVWLPFAKCGFGRDPCGKISARYHIPNSDPLTIDFHFGRTSPNGQTSLTISSISRGTITSIGEKIDSVNVSYFLPSWNNGQGRFIGPLPGSRFTITHFDQQSQIIAGEFHFILGEASGSGKRIELKDGRFDLKFNACLCDR